MCSDAKTPLLPFFYMYRTNVLAIYLATKLNTTHSYWKYVTCSYLSAANSCTLLGFFNLLGSWVKPSICLQASDISYGASDSHLLYLLWKKKKENCLRSWCAHARNMWTVFVWPTRSLTNPCSAAGVGGLLECRSLARCCSFINWESLFRAAYKTVDDVVSFYLLSKRTLLSQIGNRAAFTNTWTLLQVFCSQTCKSTQSIVALGVPVSSSSILRAHSFRLSFFSVANFSLGYNAQMRVAVFRMREPTVKLAR